MKAEALARLVERAKQGDDEAFTDLYDAFSKSVYYFALRLTKNEEDANDVVQDTMLALYQSLHSIEHTVTIAAFIKKIALHQCTRLLRKRKETVCESQLDYNSHLFEELDAEFIPEKYVDLKERQEYIVNLVDSLSEPLREVVMLFYYHHHSIAHISKLLKINESTIRTRLTRARATLKEKVQANKQDLMQSVMPVPVLTRILHAHADDVFTTELSVSIWQNIATKLGYSPEAIERTTAILVAGTSAAAGTAAIAGAGAATTGAATTAVAAIKAIASSSAAYATFIGTACLATAIGGATLLYQTTDIHVPFIAGAVAAFSQTQTSDSTTDQSQDIMPDVHIIGYDTATPQQYLPYESTVNHEESSASIADAPAYQARNMPAQNVRRQRSITPWQGETSSSQTTIIREEGRYYILTNPDVPLAPPHLPPPQETLNPSPIIVDNNQLTIAVGTAITEEQILQLSGINTTSGRGQATVSYLENVDFNTPDTYAVLAQVVDGEVVLFQRVVIVEIIE